MGYGAWMPSRRASAASSMPHGPDAVAFYVSGQLLTEDYYVANKLMKGFIGSANIDTNSRLCMSSAVAAHKRAFGEDLVPVTYEDLELADLIVLVGSNTAWCHPVLFQRIVKAKQQRPALRVVVIDPRRTPTCDIADLHLPLRAGHRCDCSSMACSAGWRAHGSSRPRLCRAAHARCGARTAGRREHRRRCGCSRPYLRRSSRSCCAVSTNCSPPRSRSSRPSHRASTNPRSGTDKANSIINAIC